MHDMQQKAQKNFEAASSDRAMTVFGVGVAFIDESSAYGLSRDEMHRAAEQMKLIVSELIPPENLYVAPIEDVYSSKINDERDRFKELLSATSDATGREDLILYLRMVSLQKVCLEHVLTLI